MISPSIAFIAWVPISLFLFQRYPIRVAILANFFAGWALLPSAVYTPTAVRIPLLDPGNLSSVDPLLYQGNRNGPHVLTRHSRCLTAKPSADLSSVFGTCQCWPGASFRCCQRWPTPRVLSRCFVANCIRFWRGGVPYLVGRLYFEKTESLKLAAEAFVIAGLAYVPICRVEIMTGPQFTPIFTAISHIAGPARRDTSDTGRSGCWRTETSLASGWRPRL